MALARNDSTTNKSTKIIEENGLLFLSSSPSVVYSTYYGHTFRTVWDEYYLPKQKSSDKYKVHVSLDLTANNFEQAREILFKILLKKSIARFKFTCEDQINRPGNSNGKELVIYMQLDKTDTNESDVNFWKSIFAEIEESLQKANIVPNKKFKPQGDRLLPESKGYLYFRNPYNILDRYVPAEALTDSKFTLAEGNSLNDDKKMETLFGSKTNDSKTMSFATNLTVFQKPVIQLVQPNDLEARIHKIKEKLFAEDFYHVFFGHVPTRSQKNEPFENIALFFKFAFQGGVTLNYGLAEEVIVKLKEETKKLRDYYQDCISIALRKIAMLQYSLQQAKIPNATCSIFPAIFFHFFKPIATVWKNNPNVAFETIVNKNKFISEMVKCSFRDESVDQLTLEKPKYVSNLSEEFLDGLISQLGIVSIADSKIDTTQKSASAVYSK